MRLNIIIVHFVLLAISGSSWAVEAERFSKGEALYREHCLKCHHLPNDCRNYIGPSLCGIIGRPSAKIKDFDYSPAMKNSGIFWTESRIDGYLTSPQRYIVPTGTSSGQHIKMDFYGIVDQVDRNLIIYYLSNVSIKGYQWIINKQTLIYPGTTARVSSNGLSIVFVGRQGTQESFYGNNLGPEILYADLKSGLFMSLSKSVDGTHANGIHRNPFIDTNGRFVVFSSNAANLVPGYSQGYDRLQHYNIFIKNAITNEIKLVSATPNGAPGNNGSESPSVSANGRIVAFASKATNLGMCNSSDEKTHIFVKDMSNGTIICVDVINNGIIANDSSQNPMISADGNFVVFDSAATNLPTGTQTSRNVFVCDLISGNVEPIFRPTGNYGDNISISGPYISSNGKYVTFTSSYYAVVKGLKRTFPRAFVKDMTTGIITLASKTALGEDIEGYQPSISDDGRFVVFQSVSRKAIPGIVNSKSDPWQIYIKDMVTGQVAIVSKDQHGMPGNRESSSPVISADGHYIVFESNASNIASGGPNIIISPNELLQISGN